MEKTVKLFSLFFLAGMLSMNTAMAQSDEEVADEDLRAYIMVMDSVDTLRAKLSEDVSALIINHELMDNGRVYTTIKAADGDAEKLEEEGITQEQIEAYEELEEQVNEMKAELNATFSEMVKEHIGVAEYKKIRKGLQSDEEIKARHQALTEEMQEGEGEEEGEPGQETAEPGLDETSN